MPKRVVFLPDDLDAASRRLKLDLSLLLQKVILEQVAQHNSQKAPVQVIDASTPAEVLDIDWSDFSLGATRQIADER